MSTPHKATADKDVHFYAASSSSSDQRREADVVHGRCWKAEDDGPQRHDLRQDFSEDAESDNDSGQFGSSGSSSQAGSSSATASNKSYRSATQQQIAAAEGRAVFFSKICMLAVLFLAAILACALTYFFVKQGEHGDFELQFEDYASEIEDVTRHNLKTTLDLIHGFGSSVTSYALSRDEAVDGFPFVTVPHFEVRARNFKQVSGAQLLAFMPLVSHYQHDKWVNYSVANQIWIEESYRLSDPPVSINQAQPVHTPIYWKTDGVIVDAEGREHYGPVWQQSPPPQLQSNVNFDLLSDDLIAKVFESSKISRRPVLSQVTDPIEIFGVDASTVDDSDEPHPTSVLVEPIFDGFDTETDKIVGAVVAVLPWDQYFENVLNEEVRAIIAVLDGTCGDSFSYRIDGSTVYYLGAGDLHSTKYNKMRFTVSFSDDELLGTQPNSSDSSYCGYTLSLYPTQELESSYYTNHPLIFAASVFVIFAFTAAVFLLYDFLVQFRQRKIQDAALKSNALVSSLFPAEVRDRLLDDNERRGTSSAKFETAASISLTATTSTHQLTGATRKGQDASISTDDRAASTSGFELYETKPIADLFLHTTVIFADIAGFTAWSSVREPAQVFTLLETVYRAFDIIAKKRHVFKVETIGDCYVAVTGLPEPRDDHAVVMTRFAKDCLKRMNELSKLLERSLGPDTGDLAMRFGLHSGPVTAGVLRGDKSRFQLFGDTVNTAARVEATGVRNRIHVSEETANLLIAAGKESWVTPRKDTVVAKGKGVMKTYWIKIRDSESVGSRTADDAAPEQMSIPVSNIHNPNQRPQARPFRKIPDNVPLSPKLLRLVSWNVDVLAKLLKQIILNRLSDPHVRQSAARRQQNAESVARLERSIAGRGNPLDEVAEVISMPAYSEKASPLIHMPAHDRSSMLPTLPSTVHRQLETYVRTIALMYRENSFHNFEHASHVTMSVSKLLARIVAPAIDNTVNENGDLAQSLHDHTYGITSDPLTQFAVVLSALIHDVDHVGIPNFLLVQENVGLASRYSNKSVAEQNSIELAWKVLMQPHFDELRECIYQDSQELARFRQLMVNTVLATDIFDKELSALRKNRWMKAFDQKVDTDKSVDVDCKATIVIEHLIQASDVAHTMQHWHIYQKWNERLFHEMTTAFQAGRSDKDPAVGWYQGELGFFDNYIIPLAKKLKECGVFGVSSDEYLNYALENRREWSAKGEEIVAKMIEKYKLPSDDDDKGEVAVSETG